MCGRRIYIGTEDLIIRDMTCDEIIMAPYEAVVACIREETSVEYGARGVTSFFYNQDGRQEEEKTVPAPRNAAWTRVLQYFPL